MFTAQTPPGWFAGHVHWLDLAQTQALVDVMLPT